MHARFQLFNRPHQSHGWTLVKQGCQTIQRDLGANRINLYPPVIFIASPAV